MRLTTDKLGCAKMVNKQTNASTKFYMDQANKIVDVLSEIVPTIYCDVFKDDFDVFMDGLWISTDEKHPPILDQSILQPGETIQKLEKTKWKSLSMDKQMEWLKRMDLQALLKALLFRPESLKLFCEKNTLVQFKMTSVLKSMVKWRNYGIGHKSVFKYEQMDENVFKLNILEPVWEFSDLLSRYYERECRLLRKELQDIERRMKYPETNVTELAELTKKPEYTVKEVLSMLKVYVDEEGHIKGEDKKELAESIKRLSNIDRVHQRKKEEKRIEREKKRLEKGKKNYWKVRIALLLSVVLLVGVSITLVMVMNRKQKVVSNKEIVVKYNDKTSKYKRINVKKDEKANIHIAPVGAEECTVFGVLVCGGASPLNENEKYGAFILATSEYYAKKGCKIDFREGLQEYYNHQKWYENKGIESYEFDEEDVFTEEEKKSKRTLEIWKNMYGEVLKISDTFSAQDYMDIAQKLNAYKKIIIGNQDWVLPQYDMY